MDHCQAVAPRQAYDLLEEGRLDSVRGRVVGVVEEEHLGLVVHLGAGFVYLAEEFFIVLDRDSQAFAAGDHNRVGMNREGGSRHKGQVAGAQQGQAQVAEAFLASDGRDDLGFRIDIDVPV